MGTSVLGVMVANEFALSGLAWRLLGTDAASLRDILTAALQQLIETKLTSTIRAERIASPPSA